MAGDLTMLTLSFRALVSWLCLLGVSGAQVVLGYSPMCRRRRLFDIGHSGDRLAPNLRVLDERIWSFLSDRSRNFVDAEKKSESRQCEDGSRS